MMMMIVKIVDKIEPDASAVMCSFATSICLSLNKGCMYQPSHFLWLRSIRSYIRKSLNQISILSKESWYI